MNPRPFNIVVCLIGIFLIVLSFFGEASAMSAASTIGGATAKAPEAQPAIHHIEKEARNQWFWCRIAGGSIVLLSICIDVQLSWKTKSA